MPGAGVRHTSSCRQAGFSLLEILVAVTILGMAYLVILQNFSFSLRNIERVERHGLKSYATLLNMEKDLMIIPSGFEVVPLEGELYVAGQKYQLVLVDDKETSGRTALMLERLP